MEPALAALGRMEELSIWRARKMLDLRNGPISREDETVTIQRRLLRIEKNKPRGSYCSKCDSIGHCGFLDDGAQDLTFWNNARSQH